MNDSKEIVLASTCLLLSIANADDNIDDTDGLLIKTDSEGNELDLQSEG